MNYLDTIIYMSSILIALFTIKVGHHLLKTYRFKFLYSYFYYLIGYNLLGLVIQLGINLAARFFSTQNPQSLLVVTSLLCLIGYPLFPFSIYMFCKTLVGLAEKELPSLFKKYFVSLWLIIFFFMIVGINQNLDKGDERLFLSFVMLGNIVGNGFLIVVIFYLVSRARHLKERIKRRAAKVFAFLYLFCFLIDFVIYFIVFNRVDFLMLEKPLVYFSKNLPPLFYLVHFLRKYHREVFFTSQEKMGLDNFFLSHNISPREQEITRLIVDGKTNKEIEDVLFISLQTVKNSITAIYKKMKVKNRIQLINLVRNQNNNQ